LAQDWQALAFAAGWDASAWGESASLRSRRRGWRGRLAAAGSDTGTMIKQCYNSISETPPFSWLKSQEVFQFLMLGLDGVGKSTLLYRIKIDGWKTVEIIKDMAHLKRVMGEDGTDCKDPGYHYEELRSHHLGRYGIWDVPGDETMLSLWPIFYRYLRIGCVLFVVDAFSPKRDNLDRIARARQQLHILLNEDELRNSAFVLILNIPETDHGKGASTEEEEQELQTAIEEMLGVSEIMEMKPHADRFRKVRLNCSTITRDEQPEWEDLMKEVESIVRAREEGIQR